MWETDGIVYKQIIGKCLGTDYSLLEATIQKPLMWELSSSDAYLNIDHAALQQEYGGEQCKD